MAALNESQIRVQAITLLEEKYSYSVIGKKLGLSKLWISKRAKRYKQSPNETLRNRYHSGRKSVLTAAAQKLIKQSKYRRGQFAKIRTSVKRQTPCWKQRDNQALYADDAEMEEFQETKSPKVN